MKSLQNKGVMETSGRYLQKGEEISCVMSKRVMYRRGTGHLTLRLCRISENFRKPKNIGRSKSGDNSVETVDNYL